MDNRLLILLFIVLFHVIPAALYYALELSEKKS